MCHDCVSTLPRSIRTCCRCLELLHVLCVSILSSPPMFSSMSVLSLRDLFEACLVRLALSRCFVYRSLICRVFALGCVCERKAARLSTHGETSTLRLIQFAVLSSITLIMRLKASVVFEGSVIGRQLARQVVCIAHTPDANESNTLGRPTWQSHSHHRTLCTHNLRCVLTLNSSH